jgi:hypothetical protein
LLDPFATGWPAGLVSGRREALRQTGETGAALTCIQPVGGPPGVGVDVTPVIGRKVRRRSW